MNMQIEGAATLFCGGTCTESITVEIEKGTPNEDVEHEAIISAAAFGWVDGICPRHAKEAARDIKADDDRKGALSE